jgi:hypothetical protein
MSRVVPRTLSVPTPSRDISPIGGEGEGVLFPRGDLLAPEGGVEAVFV